MYPMGLKNHIRNPRREFVTTSTGSWVNFSPLAFGPSMWFDASDVATITESGGSVSQWSDKSGNGRHATQATSANQPSTNVSSQNGLNLLSFNGSSSWLSVSAYAPPASGFTIFSIVDLTSNVNATILEQGDFGAGGQTGARYIWHSSTIVGADRFVFGYHDGTNFRDYISTWTFSGGIRIAMGAVTGSQVATRLSPNNETIFNRTNYPSSVSRTVYIGRQRGNTWFWTGTMGEIIVYDYELPRQVRLTIWDYLNNKWRIY